MTDAERQAEIDSLAELVVCFPHVVTFAARFPELVAEAKADPSVTPETFAARAWKALQAISPENHIADQIAADYRERAKVTVCKCPQELTQ